MFWMSISTCLLDTVTGSIPHGSPRAYLATLSLDTVEDVMVGEVDELEEDVGWSISCLEGVMDVEEGKLEEELVDKPGTIIAICFTCNRRRKSACWTNSWQDFPNIFQNNYGEDITDLCIDSVDVQWLLALVVGGNTSDSPRRSSWTSRRSGYAGPYRGGCSQNLIPPNKFYLSIRGFLTPIWARSSPSRWALRCGILTRLLCPPAQGLLPQEFVSKLPPSLRVPDVFGEHFGWCCAPELVEFQ